MWSYSHIIYRELHNTYWHLRNTSALLVNSIKLKCGRINRFKWWLLNWSLHWNTEIFWVQVQMAETLAQRCRALLWLVQIEFWKRSGRFCLFNFICIYKVPAKRSRPFNSWGISSSARLDHTRKKHGACTARQEGNATKVWSGSGSARKNGSKVTRDRNATWKWNQRPIKGKLTGTWRVRRK